VSQLPSEEANEFEALKTVSSSQNELGTHQFQLATQSPADKVDPIKWFGILVPKSLKTARDCYEKATELVVEAANVEQRLRKNCELLAKLKVVKCDFENTEE